jgi:2-octaprenyl-3-methyl-6-methoxy-1,4-benzoquinol hydroxylase/2-octaprenylphenol hydroxylase
MGVRLVALRRLGDRWQVELSDGVSISADLIVGADGMHSDVRQLAGIRSHGKNYGQTAIVAHLSTQRPHGGIARQWFNAAGTLAWLPLPPSPSGTRISIVWSVAEDRVPDLLAQDDATFAHHVQQAGQASLGEMALVSKPLAFPLSFTESEQADAEGVVLIGDAAHTVHPLAGQGLNLGLGDAFALADAIHGRGLRSLAEVLPAYRRSRRIETTGIQITTDLLARFANHPSLMPFLAWGVRRFDALTPIKQALAQLAGARH